LGVICGQAGSSDVRQVEGHQALGAADHLLARHAAAVASSQPRQ
jgi:hypothetical protein